MANQIHKLSDIEVESVGLVSLGANQKKFFLLKSMKEVNDMSDKNTDTSTVQPTVDAEEQAQVEVTDGVLAKIGDFVRSLVKKEALVAEGGEPEVEVETEPVVEADVAEAKLEVAERIEVLTKANETLLSRLEKAEKAFAIERDAREKAEYVEKAKVFKSVPAKIEELAEQLHFLYKTDEKRGEYWYSLLKAVDAQMKDGGIFTEVGSDENVAAGDGDLVAKIEKIAEKGTIEDVRKALFEMGSDAAYDYLADRRLAIKGVKK